MSRKKIHLTIEEDLSIDAMGFVSLPAVEEMGYLFSKDKRNYTFGKETEEEGLYVAPAMIANKLIYRFDPHTNEEYDVYFDEKDIKLISQNFMIYNKNNNANFDHEKPIEDVHLVYSWIVENEQDQIMTKYGFKNISVGSWITIYKINNEDVKEKMRSGEIGGLSIEGYFIEKFSKHLIKNSEENYNNIKNILSYDFTDEEKYNKIKKEISKINI